MDLIMEQSLSAAGIRSGADLIALLNAREQLAAVTNLLREEARAEAIAAFGEADGARISGMLSNMNAVGIIAQKNAWKSLRQGGHGGTIAAAPSSPQHQQPGAAGGSAWSRLTPKQQEQALKIMPHASSEQKEAFAVQYFKDAGHE